MAHSAPSGWRGVAGAMAALLLPLGAVLGAAGLWLASPPGAASGGHSASTPPRSGLSFDPPRLAGRDMWGATVFDQLVCRIAFHRLRYDGRFTPPSTQGSLIYPGNLGVFNWGGVDVDPNRQIVFATPARFAFVQATPMSYTGADGRQSLLVVAGGHGSTHTKAGDSLLAHALPSVH